MVNLDTLKNKIKLYIYRYVFDFELCRLILAVSFNFQLSNYGILHFKMQFITQVRKLF